MPSIRLDCPKADTDFGEVFCPEITVDVLLTTGLYQPIGFILDSGADCTMVPRDVANWVGFKLPNVADAHIAGISGRRIPAYKGKLKIRIKSEEFEVRCLFTESNRTPFLLGRIDVFTLFDVRFDGQNCRVILRKFS